MPTTLPPLVRSQLETSLGAGIEASSRLAGGDTNAVFKLDTARGPFVVKLRREAEAYPAQFFAESQGLALLRGAGALTVPEVLSYGTASGGPAADWAFLLLSYLSPVPETRAAQEALGHGLAQLHRVTAEQFGGTPDNFMGALPQQNPAKATAAEFFWEARLAPQLARAGLLSAADRAGFEQLRERLPRLIPAEAPALVHGDLWHGNMLYAANGPALIDPASTYAHREADLSLMGLFGGFANPVFAAYAESYPPAEGWRERADLWNLYPLLVHLNLFGESYLSRVREALAGALRL
ncbi:putative ketoamine kinase HMPREF0351_12196 [Deinococcus xinjiangensis]|uniref:Ketoamine kinase HMPREF0351_12196 n=1 Tax=Deinococcus xinjiangensis TaxID=457454 RepID=A0ABP9V8V6_9DEIO